MAMSQEALHPDPPEENPFYHLTDKDKTAIAAQIQKGCREDLKGPAEVMLDLIFEHQMMPRGPTRSDVANRIKQKFGQEKSSFCDHNVQYLGKILERAANDAGKSLVLRCARERNRGKGYYRFTIASTSPQPKKVSLPPRKPRNDAEKTKAQEIRRIIRDQKMELTKVLHNARIVGVKKVATKEKTVAQELRDAYPKPVSMQRMLDEIWGDEIGKEERSREALLGIIEKIRKAVAQAGFTTVTKGDQIRIDFVRTNLVEFDSQSKTEGSSPLSGGI